MESATSDLQLESSEGDAAIPLAHEGSEHFVELALNPVYPRRIIPYVNRSEDNSFSTDVRTYPTCPLELWTPLGIAFPFQFQKWKVTAEAWSVFAEKASTSVMI